MGSMRGSQLKGVKFSGVNERESMRGVKFSGVNERASMRGSKV